MGYYSYIDMTEEKIIKDKRNVIIYGADADALLILQALKHRNIRPTCLCDSDERKWHKHLLDVEILSPDEAISKFPDAIFLIASGFYKFQIIGKLISSGKVSADRILNYEPIEKRRSCIYLESYLVCAGHKLNYCCSDFGKNKSPFITFKGDYGLAAEEFIRYRDKLINDLNSGAQTPCDGCPCIKEDWYPLERKIIILNDGEEGICNFNCCYCKSPAKTSRNVSNDINMQELLNIFKARKILSQELHTIISCGEICVNPRRTEIFDSISQLRNTFCTNASICDQRIMQLLELGNTDLIVSVDAGTRSTFEKVKGYDLFHKVCDNLRRYNSNGGVRLKYIILPTINDNEADIDGFVSLCKDIGAKLVQVSYNLYAPKELTQRTKIMTKYLIEKLTENGIIYRIISDVISKSLTGSGEAG